MNDISTNSIIVRRDTVIGNDLSETETVMLDIDRGTYFGVKDVGKAIWDQLTVPCTFDDVCTTLRQQYDVDDETCRREVADFISYLVERGLVDVHTEESA